MRFVTHYKERYIVGRGRVLILKGRITEYKRGDIIEDLTGLVKITNVEHSRPAMDDWNKDGKEIITLGLVVRNLTEDEQREYLDGNRK